MAVLPGPVEITNQDLESVYPVVLSIPTQINTSTNYAGLMVVGLAVQYA